MIDVFTKKLRHRFRQGLQYASDIYCQNSHQRIIEKEKLDKSNSLGM